MKIQLEIPRLFSQRKNVLFVFFFGLIFFFGMTPSVHAGDAGIIGNAVIGVGNAVLGGTSAVVGGSVTDALDSGLKKLAIGLLGVEAALANAAAGLFAFILDPKAFSDIMNNGVFYEIWKIVRDTMNMLFILVLLFSAFATIYQIDKYKYNRILWMVVLMALLVNFSWPIARTIVDFFNSMMYFFVQSVFQTSGQAAASSILGSTDLKSIFLPKGYQSEWTSILLAIIVMFIFAITLLVLSLMLLIRLVALPILIMFSPVGFAGMAAPITQSYAKQWWGKLFQYASYGPIAVFMVLVSIRVLQQTQDWKSGMKATIQGMSANAGVVPTEVLSTLVYFSIPIILFWMAITSAESMSMGLSSSVTKYGMQLGKWAGRQPWRVAKGAANWTGVPGGVKQAWKERRIMFGSDSRRAREAREASVAGALAGGAAGFANTQTAAFDKRMAAELESFKKFGNVSKAQEALRSATTPIEKKKAAALYLSEKNALTNAADFQKALQSVGKDFTAAKGIITNAPKTVLTNAKEFGDSLKILNTNGHQKLFGEVVAKAEKEALGNTGVEYDKILDELKVMKADGSGIDTTATADLKKVYDKRIAEQGQAHIRVESHTDAQLRAGATTVDRNAAIKAVFDTMGADNVIKQKEIGLQSAEFIAYIKSRELEYRKQLKAAAARDGGRADTVRIWRANSV